MRRDRGAPRSSLAAAFRGGVLGAAMGLSGCAVVDEFGDRAVAYNLQAESTNNIGILLNVMRSAYRRPLQFSTFTQANGTATASAELALSLPFGAAALPAYGATPSASLSGGPSFTIVNLDTQDFYKGLLTPIDPRIIALFLRRGVSKALALTLLVDTIDIVVDNGDGKPPTNVPIYNNVDAEDKYYSRFRAVLTGLLLAGLDVEEKDIVTSIGPPLSDADARNMSAVADLAAQGIVLKRYAVKREGAVTTAEGSGLGADELKKIPADWDHFYQMETKPEPAFQLCFDPAEGGIARPVQDEAGNPGVTLTPTLSLTGIDPASLCGAPDATVASSASPAGRRWAENKNLKVQAIATDPATGKSEIRPLRLGMRPRSTAEVFWYLGEIARSELAIAGGRSFVPMIWIARDRREQPLFTVSDGPLESTLASATYLGKTYAVPMTGPSGDRSGEVMELVKELLSLNSSAKDLPQPSVISIVR